MKSPRSRSALIVAVVVAAVIVGGEVATAQNCGGQAGGKLCAGGQCCSRYGWCGKTPAHCGTGCQSQCSRVAGAKPSGEGYTVNSNITAAAGQPGV